MATAYAGCASWHGTCCHQGMLSWTLIFLVLSLLAALFGFTGIAAAFAGIARILFFLFLALLVVSLILGWRRPASPRSAGEHA